MRTTKLIRSLRGLSYTERLQKLKLPTLNYRRLRGDMIEIYKTVSRNTAPAASAAPAPQIGIFWVLKQDCFRRSAWKPQDTAGHRRPPQDAVDNRRTPNQTPQDGRIRFRPVRPMTAGRRRTLTKSFIYDRYRPVFFTRRPMLYLL